MTLYEFIHIISLINKLNDGLTLKNRKRELRKEIDEMLGILPMDKGKRPRKLSSSKNKMVSNFMVTINNLNLLENLEETKHLNELYQTDRDNFFLKLRKLILYKGNLVDHVKILDKINKKKEFKNTTQYLDGMAYEIYKKYPNISQAAHRKQLQYILKWLKDKRLGILESFNENRIHKFRSKVRF